jgi:protein-tyrosine phosphatase
MAELVLRRELAGRDVLVESAGIGAIDGAPIDPSALAVLEAHGLEGRGHAARRLEKWMIHHADLVLVMERAQMHFMQRQIPSAAGRTFGLGRWLDDIDVPDPFGQPIATFESLYGTIERASREWSARV